MKSLLLLWLEGLVIHCCFSVAVGLAIGGIRLARLGNHLSDFSIISNSRGWTGDLLYGVVFFVWTPIAVAWLLNKALRMGNGRLQALFRLTI